MGESSKSTLIPFIKLAKKDGKLFLNEIKQLFKNKPILNSKFKVIYEKDFILFPIKNSTKVVNEIKKAFKGRLGFQIIFKTGSINKKYKYRSIQEAVNILIPKKYHNLIPRSYDIIGDIAIIEFEKNINSMIKDSLKFKKIIANALIQVNRNVKSVYDKMSEIKGPFRLREIKLLYGEEKTITRHKENDCEFEVDVKKTFFTPRLVFERKRIASSEFQKNEIIIDMFAGVGPFSIQIAKQINAKIYSFDINPNAYEHLIKNISLNKLKGKIFPYNIDIKTLLNPSSYLGNTLKHKADRIIMNLPERALDFLNVACFLLKKSGGIIHIYIFSEKPDTIENAIEKLKMKLNMINYHILDILNAKIVKNFSPKSDLVVVDLLLEKN